MEIRGDAPLEESEGDRLGEKLRDKDGSPDVIEEVEEAGKGRGGVESWGVEGEANGGGDDDDDDGWVEGGVLHDAVEDATERVARAEAEEGVAVWPALAVARRAIFVEDHHLRPAEIRGEESERS